MSAIHIIDDDRALCRSLQIQLESAGHTVSFATTAGEGLAAVRKTPPDLILLDLGLPDRSGLKVLEELRRDHEDSAVVMITGQQDSKATIRAMRLGAFDYIRKPFDLDDVLLVLEKLARFRALERRGTDHVRVPSGPTARGEIVGNDRQMLEVVKQIGLLSRSRVTVLIEGESGTGKELVARALHEATSPEENFVAINCSAVVPTLMESELFGHVKGAFTGAESSKDGKLAHAGRGTIFFDEISEIGLDLQGKILRAVQEREFERVGGLEPIALEARVVAATNRSLEALVEEGKFREDLFYRLAVTRLTLPPLRDRRGDIPLLVRHLLERVGRGLGRTVVAVEDRALQRLQAHDWPGNVRELENVLTRAAALAPGEVLSVEDIAVALARRGTDLQARETKIVPLHVAEKAHIERALAAHGWNITRTARILEISPTTLRKKITDYRLNDPRVS